MIIKDVYKNGFIIFLLSELIFFFSFFWVLFDELIVININFLDNWIPYGINFPYPFFIPFLNTIILLLRGIFINIFLFKFLLSKKNLINFILVLFLGFIFIFIQILEYYLLNYIFSDSIFRRNFFLLTGFHGFHVFLGFFFLIFCFFSIYNLLINKENLNFNFSILYWHFVDLIWIFVFLFIYYFNYLEYILLKILFCLIKENFLILFIL